MKYDLKAIKAKAGDRHVDVFDRCAKLTLTAMDKEDEVLLGALGAALFEKKDKGFNAWARTVLDRAVAEESRA